MLKNIMLFCAVLCLAGCASVTKPQGVTVGNDQSFLMEGELKPGITKERFIELYGKPYKQSFRFDSDSTLHEDLYYKRNLNLGAWYLITTVFHFEDSVLVSQTQEKEERLYGEGCSCKN